MVVSVHIAKTASKSTLSVAWVGKRLVCNRLILLKNPAIEIALTPRSVLSGAQAAIGVFLFGTDSAIDRAVGRGETFPFDNRATSALNITNVEYLAALADE